MVLVPPSCAAFATNNKFLSNLSAGVKRSRTFNISSVEAMTNDDLMGAIGSTMTLPNGGGIRGNKTGNLRKKRYSPDSLFFGMPDDEHEYLEHRSGDGSTLAEHNGIAGYYGHSSGGSSGHCSATSMSYDSSCSTDSSRKSSNSSTNGSANTVGGNSRYAWYIIIVKSN